jgi:hypothetical protein
LRRQIPQRSQTVCALPRLASLAHGKLLDPFAKKSALIFGIFAAPGFLLLWAASWIDKQGACHRVVSLGST